MSYTKNALGLDHLEKNAEQSANSDSFPPVVTEEQCQICGQLFEDSHACLQAIPASLLTLIDPRVGTVVAQHFILEDFVCNSDTSLVYKARHQLLNTYVAVKIANEVTEPDPFSALRTNRAALIATRLDHPNIVRTIHFVHEQADNALLIMEWANGIPLAQVIASQVPIAPLRALNIIEGLCDALRYAHIQGVNHINLKPSGILVTQINGGEQARLLDFGVMKMLAPQTVEAIAKSQHIKYASPEECAGQPPDQRAMIYSLGMILFDMLTGQIEELSGDAQIKTPFIAPALVKVRPDLQEASTLDTILTKCLARKAAQRYQTLDEFGCALTDAKIELERIESSKLLMQNHVEPQDKPTPTLLLVLLVMAVLMTIFYAVH
jgi:eukaryotic-like serine/threonine-protein kinase